MDNSISNTKSEQYGWLELLSKNPEAKNFVFNRYRLSELSYLNDFIFPTADVSIPKLELITSNTYNKIKQLVNYKNEIVNDLDKYGDENIKQIPFVKLTTDYLANISHVPIQLIYTSYDTNHLKNDSLKKCNGEFEIVQCFLNYREIFKYASSCMCHGENFLAESSFDIENQDYHNTKRRYFIAIDNNFPQETIFAINSINKLYAEKFSKK